MLDFDALPLRGGAGGSRGTVLGLHLQAIRPDGTVVAERLDIEPIATGGKSRETVGGRNLLHRTDLVLPPGPYRIRARVSDDRRVILADRTLDLTLEPGNVRPGLASTGPADGAS